MSSKEQAFFNFMAAVTFCSDFWNQGNKVFHCFHCCHICLPWSDGTGSHDLLQEISPIQGMNPGLPHCKWILYQLSHQGSPIILKWVACPFSSGSSWPRSWIRVSCIAGGFFTCWASLLTWYWIQEMLKIGFKKYIEKTLLCRRPQFNSWVRKIPWRRDRLPTSVFLGFPCGSAGKESACNVGDLDSNPGLGRSLGEGKGYPLQYSGLENSTDCIVQWGHKESD